MKGNTADKILNTVFGSKNVLVGNSNSEFGSVHVGDQNIFVDLKSEQLSTKCPRCGHNANEETAEENTNYKSFHCDNCNNTYYEYDQIARNASNFIDLDGKQSIEFERLISAVNHDLRVGFLDEAFQRCLKHKETYGNTPQIYEWGALTLFLNTNPENLINTSCRQVIIYLERAQEIDKKNESPTYMGIVNSIATRYFQMVFSRIKNEKRAINKLRKEDDYKSKLDEKRRHIFKLLKELHTCYKIKPDIRYIETGIEELYGYHQLAWFERRWLSMFIKPKFITKGYRRYLKGFVWDYHKIISNCDNLFEKKGMTPSRLTILFEKMLLKESTIKELAEIKVGDRYNESTSAKGNLVKKAFSFYFITGVLLFGLYYWKLHILLIATLVLFAVFLFLNYKFNSINIDQFRRIIQLDKEEDLVMMLEEVKGDIQL